MVLPGRPGRVVVGIPRGHVCSGFTGPHGWSGPFGTATNGASGTVTWKACFTPLREATVLDFLALVPLLLCALVIIPIYQSSLTQLRGALLDFLTGFASLGPLR